jgi:hypothetical protein
MATTSGSSEMSIRKFDETNFNFWNEQMHDYLIVRGQIDPVEYDTAPAIQVGSMDKVGPGSSHYHSNASV